MSSTEQPPGIAADLDRLYAALASLRKLASEMDDEQDGAKLYDFSIRWGTLMSGRLLRLEHYYREDGLSRNQKRRYGQLRGGLREATPLIERLGIARPGVPLEDEEKPNKE